MRAGAERYVHVLEDITFGVCLVKIPCLQRPKGGLLWLCC